MADYKINNDTKFVIVGAGKIAWSITAALVKSGLKVNAIISRNLLSAKNLAKEFDVHFYSDIPVLPTAKAVYFLCVPDSEIKIIAKQFSTLAEDFSGSLFVHNSGALSSDELKPLAIKNALTASYHIMQTFPAKVIVPLEGCYASIESASPVTVNALKSLSKKLSIKSFLINKKDKALYHTSGVSLSNFLIANIYNSRSLFKKISGNDFNPDEIIIQNLEAALNNIKSKGVFKSLSGPVERGDVKTIMKHIQTLKKLGGKGKNYRLTAYISQSLILLDFIAERDGKISANQSEIRKILVKEL